MIFLVDRQLLSGKCHRLKILEEITCCHLPFAKKLFEAGGFFI